MIVALTGATGAVGSALLQHLGAQDWVEGLVVLGRRRPRSLPESAHFVRWELGDPWPAEAVSAAARRGVDALVHAAFIIEDTPRQAEAFAANVEGSLRLLSTASGAGVRHITFVSSANAYGLRSGPVPLAESEPISDAPHHFYLHHKFLCEIAIRSFAQLGGDTTFAIARPCMVVGPGVANSALSTMTSDPLFYPAPAHSSYQFIGVDDVAGALARIASSGAEGTFNLAPDDSVTVRDIARAQGHRAIWVPLWLARKASDLGFALGLTTFSSRWVTYGDPVMRPSRSRDVLGWRASRSSREALRLISGTARG